MGGNKSIWFYIQEMMMEYQIVKAGVEDEQTLCDIFFGHIEKHNEYISHGEIQMGVGEGRIVDGRLVAVPAARGRHYWMKYIHGNITDEEGAAVYKAVTSEGIAGFCVAEIMEDGADPFGMVCDVLVKENSRAKGMGTALLDKAIEWLRSRGISDIYLESGLENHAAHEYFMRRGFVKVSEIYKLK